MSRLVTGLLSAVARFHPLADLLILLFEEQKQMDILAKRKRKGTSITLSEKELDFLHLMALHNETKRSPMLSTLIKEKYNTLPNLIKGISDRAWSDWKDNQEHEFDTYLKLVASSLHGSSIAAHYIKLITDELKERHEKNN